MKELKILVKSVLLLFMIITSTGCAKDVIEQPETNLSSIADSEKFARINNFISISWLTPVDKIGFDKNKQEFTFGPAGKYKLSLIEMTKVYDNANEYKAKYEKQ